MGKKLNLFEFRWMHMEMLKSTYLSKIRRSYSYARDARATRPACAQKTVCIALYERKVGRNIETHIWCLRPNY